MKFTRCDWCKVEEKDNPGLEKWQKPIQSIMIVTKSFDLCKGCRLKIMNILENCTPLSWVTKHG
jgi:hypothetical protein